MNELERKIIDISYERKLSHIGSCLTTVNTLDKIYADKSPEDIVVLGNSHAALALFVVLEKYGKGNARKLQEKYGTHASRDLRHDVWVSGGSLGQAETVAVGLAMADPKHNVHLVTSDGACGEGSVWEALRIASEQRLKNLKITVIANGYSALEPIDIDILETRLNTFFPIRIVRINLFQFPKWLHGVDAHYIIMDETKYKEITNG